MRPVEVASPVRPRSALWVLAALGYGWVAGGFRPFTWPAAVSTALAGAFVLAMAWRLPRPVSVPPVQRSVAVSWVCWLSAATGWELWALFNHPRVTYPTISSLINPLIETHSARSVAVVAWLALGWWLARQ